MRVRSYRVCNLLLSTCMVMAFAAMPLGASEKSDWRDAQNADTVSAYQGFIQKHPKAKEVPLADSRIRELKWQAADKANTVESYQAFAAAYPNDANSKTADVRIAKLLERVS